MKVGGPQRKAGPGQYRRAEAEELYKMGARGGAAGGAAEGAAGGWSRGAAGEERRRRRRRSRRIKSENHSQRFGNKYKKTSFGYP